eukprot:SAG22_NODE_13883_length_392_cov_0.696246_1_plen_29_part_01
MAEAMPSAAEIDRWGVCHDGFAVAECWFH